MGGLRSDYNVRSTITLDHLSCLFSQRFSPSPLLLFLSSFEGTTGSTGSTAALASVGGSTSVHSGHTLCISCTFAGGSFLGRRGRSNPQGDAGPLLKAQEVTHEECQAPLLRIVALVPGRPPALKEGLQLLEVLLIRGGVSASCFMAKQCQDAYMSAKISHKCYKLNTTKEYNDSLNGSSFSIGFLFALPNLPFTRFEAAGKDSETFCSTWSHQGCKDSQFLKPHSYRTPCVLAHLPPSWPQEAFQRFISPPLCRYFTSPTGRKRSSQGAAKAWRPRRSAW